MTKESSEDSNSLSSPNNDTTNPESTSSPLNSPPANEDISSASKENGAEKDELEEEEEAGAEQMELPPPPPPPPPPKMPEDTVWEACWDENSKNYYYWNTETDEVTWDNPFEGVTDNNKSEKEEETASDNNDDTNTQENEDENGSENYEIEVEGYEEALAEQQKKEQEEKEKEKEKENEAEKTNGAENTATTSTTAVDQTAYAYANPADPNYYYYGGGYGYDAYGSYYNTYDYSQYPTTAYAQTGATADKDTLSNFDSLLNKIDDAKEILDDLAGGDTTNSTKEKAKDAGENEEGKGKKEGEEEATSKDKPLSYADYWGDYNAYAYPTPEATAAAAVPAASGQFQEYSVTGYFNKRTGRFQQTTNEMMSNPQDYFTPESKGERQMQYYFNPEAYQQQYNNMHQSGDTLENTEGDHKRSSGKRKLTRKEIEHFKKLKKQKRDDKLKRKYMD